MIVFGFSLKYKDSQLPAKYDVDFIQKVKNFSIHVDIKHSGTWWWFSVSLSPTQFITEINNAWPLSWEENCKVDFPVFGRHLRREQHCLNKTQGLETQYTFNPDYPVLTTSLSQVLQLHFVIDESANWFLVFMVSR